MGFCPGRGPVPEGWSGRQFGTAFGAPARNDTAPADGRHTGAEAVAALADKL